MIDEGVSILGRLVLALTRFFVEIVFFNFCGHVGSLVLRIVSFSKIQIDPTEGGESVLASGVGLLFLLAVAVVSLGFFN